MKNGRPTPGSHAAYNLGCTCPMMDNHHGRGRPGPRGQQFYINAKCPLHGGGVTTVLRWYADKVDEGFKRLDSLRAERARREAGR